MKFIRLTKITGSVLILQTDLIESIEITGQNHQIPLTTMIETTNNSRYFVNETPDQIYDVLQYIYGK